MIRRWKWWTRITYQYSKKMKYTTPNDIVIYGILRSQQIVILLTKEGMSYHSCI